MPLPIKEELVEKYGPNSIPAMTRSDVERQRAERERYWAQMDEEDKKTKQDRSRHHTDDGQSSKDATGDEAPRILADVTRPMQSIYGSLQSAKKRKRDGNGNDEPPSNKIKSRASSASPPANADYKENMNPSSFAPAKKAPRKSVATYASKAQIDTRQLATMAWYKSVNMKAKFGRSDFQRVTILLEDVARYVKAAQSHNESEMNRRAQELRETVQKLEFYKFLSGVIIKKSKVLEDKGLPAIFDNQDGVEFPYDIRADALALYNRWIVGDLDGHMLRGINTEKSTLDSGKKRTGHKIDPKYVRKSGNVIGHNDLVNGQWWPNRLCLLRDGAHGEVEAGISGQTGRGAFSIVVSKGEYADKDFGEVIKYCGTESDTSSPTKNTNLMLEAETLKNQIRLFRSENKTSQYAPKKGIRYDGLYVITGHEVLNPATAMYRFTLERCPGQDPIRYQGVEARPNDHEMKEYMGVRELLASMG